MKVPEPIKAEPIWRGDTVAILGCGPSLAQENLEPLHGCRVVAINRTYQYFPRADVLFTGGFQFFQEHKVRSFKGRRIICCDPRAWQREVLPRQYHVDYIRHDGYTRLTHDRNAVSGRYTSVSQAMSLVAHFGVRRILLVGVDLNPGPNNQRRAGSALKDTPDATARYVRMAQNLHSLKRDLDDRGINVYVCSPTDRLPWWPKLSLEDAIWS